MASNSKSTEKDTGIPRHIAFIMDGNGRWAEKRGLPRHKGHEAGVKNIRPLIKYLGKRGVEYITLYAFSTENWNRPEDEVNGLFHLLEEVIEEESRELHKNNVRICHIGSLKGISASLKQSINKALNLTKNNTGLTVGVAFNYGGRAEIVEAVRRIVIDEVKPRSINENLFGEYLYTAGFPEVDMVIRTGGEFRTSNFLIWQAAYSEYYFTPVQWPDFNEECVKKALSTYSQRQRRFGGL
ncbi:MAG TPA: di-trans,poly-cis-decaprenylcistransferase [Dehalococcoidia bacterium]|nr:di-trans,poly-cis-decaprenylcistransferase [Dehalococcoidia bacterium]